MKTNKLILHNFSTKLSRNEMKMVMAGFMEPTSPTATAHCSDGTTVTAGCKDMNGTCAAVDNLGATCTCSNGKDYMQLCKNVA